VTNEPTTTPIITKRIAFTYFAVFGERIPQLKKQSQQTSEAGDYGKRFHVIEADRLTPWH
jgi:hypothetical protein